MAEETWTDDPTAAGTAIKAVHCTELQAAVDAYNVAYGEGAAVWTNEPNAVDAIEDTEWDELITEIGVIAAASTKGGDYGWVNDPCAAGDIIDSVMIEEIRDNMNDLQANYCITCDTCDVFTCDCNPACNADSCDQCDSSCYGQGCTCNPGCHNDSCTSCHSACNSQSCKTDSCNCNPSCNGDSCTQCNSACYGQSCTCNSTCNNNVCDTCDGSCNSESCGSCDAAPYRYPWV